MFSLWISVLFWLMKQWMKLTWKTSYPSYLYKPHHKSIQVPDQLKFVFPLNPLEFGSSTTPHLIEWSFSKEGLKKTKSIKPKLPPPLPSTSVLTCDCTFRNSFSFIFKWSTLLLGTYFNVFQVAHSFEGQLFKTFWKVTFFPSTSLRYSKLRCPQWWF